jgi:hypothetical protein
MRARVATLLFSATLIATSAAVEPTQTRELSFRKLPLRPGERIAAIQIDITGAAFQKVSIPYDWGIEITPPVGDACTLKATGQHGSAFLFPTSPELHRFATLSLDPPPPSRPFTVEVQFVGYSYDSATQKEEQRLIKLPKECVVIQ